MSSVLRFHPPPRPAAPPPAPRAARRATAPPRERLGQILLDMGAVTPDDLLRASAQRMRLSVPLATILRAEGMVDEPALLTALGRHWRAPVLDLGRFQPDLAAVKALGVDFCLAEGIVPLLGPVRHIATAQPERFAALAPRLPPGRWQMALAAPAEIEALLLSLARADLTRRAETRTAPALSCRSLDGRRIGLCGAGAAAFLLVLALGAPGALAAAFLLWSTLVIALQAALKVTAFAAAARRDRPAATVPRQPGWRPVVSVIVALRGEPEVAGDLLRRLARLDYPRALLDVLIVTEADDAETRAALAAAGPPPWIRLVTVPPGSVRTKPRALNYALPLARGEIVGIYDAEDAPAPDQLFRVVAALRTAPADVACVQCILDYHQPRTNWLSRCFTAEYAVWFRAMLPGLARLHLVVPLGGTSVFFRRAVLEGLGGWDAHNVTEDADLGLRLARAGYRTEVIDSVTEEEPNCRLYPWVRQRSRWLKGYAMTWAVHMRDPVRLWRDLGARRFLAVQVLFLGTLSQFLLAPMLWAAWVAGPGGLAGLAGLAPPVTLYILAAAIDIAVAAWAVRGPRHRHLWPWLPTLVFYFPLATVAAWKGVAELLTRPFYWDKTRHGLLPAAPPVSGS